METQGRALPLGDPNLKTVSVVFPAPGKVSRAKCHGHHASLHLPLLFLAHPLLETRWTLLTCVLKATVGSANMHEDLGCNRPHTPLPIGARARPAARTVVWGAS